MFEHSIFSVDSRAGTCERNCRERHAGRNYTEFSECYALQLALCDLAERMFSREDVTWNWCYYHELIVIVASAVKGTLYGSVRVPRENLIGMILRGNNEVNIAVKFYDAKFQSLQYFELRAKNYVLRT